VQNLTARCPQYKKKKKVEAAKKKIGYNTKRLLTKKERETKKRSYSLYLYA
jgi:hypothetical protein